MSNNKADTNPLGRCESNRLTEVELDLINVFRQLKEEHHRDVLRFVSALLAAQ